MIVLVLAAVASAIVWYTGGQLPEFVATHFGAGGEPNAFMTRSGYRAFMAMLVLVVPPFVAWLPRLVGARWPHLLNVPNREYWLALERRAGTLAGVVARTELLAGVLVAMFCFVHWLVLRANAAASPRLDEALFLYGIGAFIAFLIGWIVAFYARFRR